MAGASRVRVPCRQHGCHAAFPRRHAVLQTRISSRYAEAFVFHIVLKMTCVRCSWRALRSCCLFISWHQALLILGRIRKQSTSLASGPAWAMSIASCVRQESKAARAAVDRLGQIDPQSHPPLGDVEKVFRPQLRKVGSRGKQGFLTRPIHRTRLERSTVGGYEI